MAQVPTVAFAQGVNITQAEALYNQGTDLVKAQKYKEACERFSASLKLDETINTRVALARCFDLQGKTASSWGEYLTASKKGAGTPAGQYAADQAKLVEKKLLKAHLTMNPVPDDLVIKLDGESIPKETLNADLPLDPGEHIVEATASHKHSLTQHFTLAANNSPFAVSLVLEDMTAAEIKAQEDKIRAGGSAGGVPGNEVVEEPGNPVKRWIGVGAIGVGAVGIIYGVVALVQATGEQSKFSQEGSGLKTCTAAQNTLDPSAPGAVACHHTDSNGLTHADRANRFFIQTGVAAGLGVVFAGVGTYLVLTSFGYKRVVKHDAFQITPIITPEQAGFSVAGRF